MNKGKKGKLRNMKDIQPGQVEEGKKIASCRTNAGNMKENANNCKKVSEVSLLLSHFLPCSFSFLLFFFFFVDDLWHLVSLFSSFILSLYYLQAFFSLFCLLLLDCFAQQLPFLLLPGFVLLRTNWPLLLLFPSSLPLHPDRVRVLLHDNIQVVF